MADPVPPPSPRVPGGEAGASARIQGNPLLAALRRLGGKIGLNSQTPSSEEIRTPLAGQTLKRMLTDLICEKALTAEAYEADKDKWQPMTLQKWQSMYLKSYCIFNFNGGRVSLTLFMRHWEHVVGQSIMFDHENFQNSLNGIVNEWGWFVESFTMPDQNVTVTFHRYNSNVLVRKAPSSLYYFSAAWNKEDILKNGLLPTASANRAIGRRVAEYDVLFKSFNLVHIRSIAKDMYEAAVEHSNSEDVSTNILRLIGYMPIIVFKVNTTKIKEHVWARQSPVYDEDKENGILLSYTYLPPAAFEMIMHEDSIPSILELT